MSSSNSSSDSEDSFEPPFAYYTDEDDSDEYKPDESDTESSDEFEHEPLVIRLRARSRDKMDQERRSSHHHRAPSPHNTTSPRTSICAASTSIKREYSAMHPDEDMRYPASKHARHQTSSVKMEPQSSDWRTQEREVDRLHEARQESDQLLADLHKLKMQLEEIQVEIGQSEFRLQQQSERMLIYSSERYTLNARANPYQRQTPGSVARFVKIEPAVLRIDDTHRMPVRGPVGRGPVGRGPMDEPTVKTETAVWP
ncbi:hypothetical protein M011DRAFT_470299 [Sporormia fimetaria CBS 119925]|uniref:Uncharacterized protein n=1 Tax=Sporormia fimetaria CBS 119925 TaxID=1340428 RepID=A0A6A6V2D3_9PLEO|nr:hypothetical protein M011DRAFT_470299 [Sporormia fimetaria CBS 119925]